MMANYNIVVHRIEPCGKCGSKMLIVDTSNDQDGFTVRKLRCKNPECNETGISIHSESDSLPDLLQVWAKLLKDLKQVDTMR